MSIKDTNINAEQRKEIHLLWPGWCAADVTRFIQCQPGIPEDVGSMLKQGDGNTQVSNVVLATPDVKTRGTRLQTHLWSA